MHLFKLSKRLFICNNLPSKNTFCTNNVKISDLLLKWTNVFTESNIPEPRESAEEIMIHVLGSNKRSILERNLSKWATVEQRSDMGRLCDLRLRRLPVQYIIGEWQFRDLTIKMRPPVFIPRPETELLVDIILSNPDFSEADRILEIGCGTGAISLALLKATTNLNMFAVDRNKVACELTRENAILNNVEDRLTVHHHTVTENEDLLPLFGGPLFNCIVSNPPYIPTKDMAALAPEISLYEDANALHGGETGLDVILPILKQSAKLLLPGGRIYLEVDTTHPPMIERWLTENQARVKLKTVETFRDVFGNPRFVLIA